MKTAPTVNLNTAAVIAALVGEYNESSAELIHLIADNEESLIKGCASIEEYTAKVSTFINEQTA